MMNSRELVRGLIGRGEFDRVGLFEHFWPETPTIWIDQGYPTRTVDKEGREVTEPVETRDCFPFDMYPSGGWFDTIPVRGEEEVLDETDEWIVKRNGAGAAFKTWKHKSGTPEHMDFLMSSREIWERDYRSHMLELDKDRIAIDDTIAALAAGRKAEKWTFYGHTFVWETLRRNLGDMCLYESLLLDPGWIHDFNRVHADFFQAHYRVLFEEAGVPDGIWVYEDLGYRDRLFASPETLRQLIFPYFTELISFFKSYGLPVVLHSCGNVAEAMPMIVEAGFDALNPMEVKAGNDLFAYAEQYGDKLAFIGGMDIRILETNDADTIRRGVTELVEGMKSRGARYVFGCDHSITPLVKLDSYRLALDVYREHMMF